MKSCRQKTFELNNNLVTKEVDTTVLIWQESSRSMYSKVSTSFHPQKWRETHSKWWRSIKDSKRIAFQMLTIMWAVSAVKEADPQQQQLGLSRLAQLLIQELESLRTLAQGFERQVKDDTIWVEELELGARCRILKVCRGNWKQQVYLNYNIESLRVVS